MLYVDCIICFDMVYWLCSDINIDANTTDFRLPKLLSSTYVEIW